MSLDIPQIDDAKNSLKQEFDASDDKKTVLRSAIFKSLYSQISETAPAERAEFGRLVNELKMQVQEWVEKWDEEQTSKQLEPLDITAPFAANTPSDDKPHLLPVSQGSLHPIASELETIADIFVRMGFSVVSSRLIDDDYHMFGSLNFPKGHPARDDYDTFLTEEGLVLPAHTSTMQNRILKEFTPPIMAVIPGRVFRNEDLDATHEHTFSQVEGVVVAQAITLGDMLGTFKTFFEEYFDEKVEYKTQPFYFPFVEPGLEFLIKKPKSLTGGVASNEWLEVMGCGMIHPNVLTQGGIDPKKYQGFAWGMGVERLTMLKYAIEDIRHFNSGKLAFLKQFGVKL